MRLRTARALAVGLSLALLAAAPLSARQDPPPDKPPVRVGGTVKEPTRITYVTPTYPDIAKSAKIQGTVIIEAVIAKDGSVKNARVLKALPLLDEAALAAVRQWKYVPTYLEGEAVDVVMVVSVAFSLK